MDPGIAHARGTDEGDGLFLTYGTVRDHLASAVAKLGARNRVDAVRISDESGWI